ncbi:MAG: flavin reductase family protein [Pseudomonadota bacterium]
MIRDEYLAAMSRAANSVTVVTTDGPAGKVGVTVSAMCSVSVDDQSATLLVCVHELSPARAAITENGVFCANLLGDDQMHVSDSFAGRSGASGVDKFNCGEWAQLATGAPALVGALASFDCRLRERYQVGTHHIFIGEIQCVDSTEGCSPLIYHDRRYRRMETQLLA